MTANEFNIIANLHRLRANTREAVRLVLVDGMSNYAAAGRTNIAASTIGRVIARIAHNKCAYCDHDLLP